MSRYIRNIFINEVNFWNLPHLSGAKEELSDLLPLISLPTLR